MTYAGEDKVEEQRWNELLAAVARAMEKPPGGGSGTRVTSRRGDYRYRNVRVLGYGGEGVVLVAQRLSPDRPTQDPTTRHVVMKLPFRRVKGMCQLATDEAAMNALRAEHIKRGWLGEAPHLSQKPEIVDVSFDVFDDVFPAIKVGPRPSTIPMLVTLLGRHRDSALIPTNLQNVMPKEGCWSSRELLNWSAIVRAVGRALWSIHGLGWAHGDIKPPNIVLYESHGRWFDVHLVDFGLAHPDLPGQISPLGTPEYRRPRQTPALRPATEDLFALGVTLVEVLLGSVVTVRLRRAARLLARQEIRLAKAPQLPSPAALTMVSGKKGPSSPSDAPMKQIDENAEPLPRESVARKYVELLVRHVKGELAYATKNPKEASQNAMRVAALRLCDVHLFQEMGAGRRTIDVLRELLASVDVRLVGAGDPETMFNKLLLWVGATKPGAEIREARRRYLQSTAPQSWVDPGNEELPSDPATGDGKVPISTQLDKTIQRLREGYGRIATNDLKLLIDGVCELEYPELRIPDSRAAYAFCQALRLLCGVLLVRERQIDDALERLTRVEALASNGGLGEEARRAISWWVRHLRRRLQFVRSIRESSSPSAAIAGAPEPWPIAQMDDEDRRAKEAADRWSQSLEFDIRIENGERLERPDFVAMRGLHDRRESSHEAAYGSTQLLRGYGRNALNYLNSLSIRLSTGLTLIQATDPQARSEDSEVLTREIEDELTMDAKGAVSALEHGVNTFLLSVGWTVVVPMPHELALALRTAARFILALMTALDELIELFNRVLDALDAARPTVMNAVESEVTLPLSSRYAHMHPRCYLSVDREAALMAAAVAFLGAADAYVDLEAPEEANRSFREAAKCFQSCVAPEHKMLAIQWLSYARNSYLLRSDSPSATHDARAQATARDKLEQALDQSVTQWQSAAFVAYRVEKDEDPGNIVGRAMFNEHGVDIAAETDDGLAVELLDTYHPSLRGAALSGLGHAAEALRKSPHPNILRGETVYTLLRGLSATTSGRQRAAFLEVDCGLGEDCKRVASMSFRKGARFEKIVGTETMDWCLLEAQRSQGKDGMRFEKIDWTRHEGGALGLDEKFDVIWLHDVLCRVTNRKATLNRIAGKLADKEGIVMMTDWVQVAPARQDDWEAVCKLGGIVTLETPETYQTMLESIGLRVMEWSLHSEEMRAFFDSVAATLRDNAIKGDTRAAHRAEIPQRLSAFVMDTPPSAPRAPRYSPLPSQDEAGTERSKFLSWMWLIACRVPPDEVRTPRQGRGVIG